jgi:hypothetical protein
MNTDVKTEYSRDFVPLAPMGVTTMNVYGRAMTDGKRQAHGNVVQMVLQAPAKKDLTVGRKNHSLKWSRMVLELRLAARNVLKELVAGEGFEPSTFGL